MRTKQETQWRALGKRDLLTYLITVAQNTQGAEVWRALFVEQLTSTVKSLTTTIEGVLTDESGQDLVEYALIVAAVALALVVSISTFTHAVQSVYVGMAGKLTGIEWQEARR